MMQMSAMTFFQSLENALVQDEHNLYRSRNAFFYAPNADPALLEVKYKVAFAENITEEVLPYCTDRESSSVTINQTEEVIRRWTSRGLYLWIEPVVLNHMQMMLPFCILRLIRQLRVTRGNPEMDAFLWDGTFELPTLHINLNVTSLPCTPSKEVLNFAIDDLTQFVSNHAKR